MFTRQPKGLLAVACLATACLATGSAVAQTYPSRLVRLIVPFPAGGGVDVTARGLAQALTDIWGQQVIVENRAGAGAIIGSDLVAKSAPDGHTLLVTTSGHALLPVLYRKLPFDAVNDFAPVTDVHNTYLVLTVTAKLPAANIKELIAYARANPGKLNYGTVGSGSLGHLGSELLRAGRPNTVEAKPRLCTMQSATNHCRIPGPYGYKWPKLDELHRKLFNEPLAGAHRALVDVRACARCYFELRRLKVMA